MAYSAPFLRLTYSGTLADGKEIWSTGHSLAINETLYTPEDALTFVGDALPGIGGAFAEFYIDARALTSSYTTLTSVKVALIGTDGKYMAPPVEVELSSTGAIANPYSPQDANVITLQSNKWKDPGKYNRMYIPTFGTGTQGVWRLTTAEQTALATAFGEYLDSLQSYLYDGQDFAVATPAVVSGTGLGSELEVSAIRVGAILDTQRRRRNKLDEDYQQIVWTRPPPA